MTRIVACLLVVGVPAQALGAQGAEPLRKTDLIRLLSSPLVRRSEVADLVRRNCLAFRPTERDWADLRLLGADAEVMSSIGGCTARAPSGRRGAAAPTPRAPLVVAGLTSRLGGVAGTDAFVRVEARRGDEPQAGVALTLRGSGQIPGGAARDLQAVTDETGVAVFPVPAGRQPGVYRLEVVSGAGAPFPGRPAVDLVVRAGPPATADVQPDRLELGGRQEGPFPVQVAVRDAFGNPVPNEPLELRPGSGEMGVPPGIRTTDSLGRATFLIDGAALRRPGAFEVRARGGQRIASLEAVFAGPVVSAGTGFVSGGRRRGVARTLLPEPLVFQARGVSGRPLPGRVVRFRSRNAQVSSDSAVTDSAGRATVEVTLGTQAGAAVVTAALDSVEVAETLFVDPRSAAELILERDGTRVDGGRIIAELGVPFTLTLKARDGYGNTVPTSSLARAARDLVPRFNARRRLLKALGVQSDSLTTSVTFKPTGLGSTDLAIAVGLTATVLVEVVAPRK